RSKSTNKAARRRRPSLRPDFELLEDRRLLAPFFVTNNTDGGPGSLRQVIDNANANPGLDTISFNITVGAISEVAIPTLNSVPAGITAGPDGNLWFTEFSGDRIGRITPGGTVTEFSTGITPNSDPDEITAGPDGNLWFTEASGDRIGRITPGGTVTEFSAGITPNSEPRGITAGPDGNLWFTEASGDRIGRITPGGTVTEFSTGITPNSRPFR